MILLEKYISRDFTIEMNWNYFYFYLSINHIVHIEIPYINF